MSPSRLPVYYLSHGGGPWPFMKAALGGRFDRLEESLIGIRDDLGVKPKAVLVISGHWEGPDFAVSSAQRPPMVYDYSGFPEYTYHVRYDAPGSPDLASRVQDLLQSGGLPCRSDPARGFDHGTFSLLKPLYPDAEVPVVQLAMRSDFDPAAHIRAGILLAPLRDEGVLIIGSGSSYHNLRRWNANGAGVSQAFDAWLQETVAEPRAPERAARLVAWTAAPHARDAHPREDHLIPLMVAAGAAGDDLGTCIYHEDAFMGAIALSSFRFGEVPQPS